MPKALTIVRQFYPNVSKVQDAEKWVDVEVTKGDVLSSEVKNHHECALAQACKRSFKADGVIISLSTAYVVDGATATRYRLGPSVAREIISFDRRGGFSPGRYAMCPPTKSNKLGVIKSHKGTKNSGPRTSKLKRQFHHHTSEVRTSLLSVGKTK